MADFIGLLGFIVTVVSAITGWVGSYTSKPDGVQVRIWAALDGAHGDLNGAGGNIPIMEVYDNTNTMRGKNANIGTIYSNYQIERKIDTTAPTQLDWLKLYAYTNMWDAVCMTRIDFAVSQKHPANEGSSGFVLGNIWEKCGMTWYHSGQYETRNGAVYWYLCGWLDGDRSATALSAVKMNMRFFSNSQQEWNLRYRPNEVCSSQMKWGIYTTATRKIKRSENNFNYSIVSPIHSATALCNSSTSYGPNFVSLKEMLYCDMTQKILYEICTSTTQINCFNYSEKLQKRDGIFKIMPIMEFQNDNLIDNTSAFIEEEINQIVKANKTKTLTNKHKNKLNKQFNLYKQLKVKTNKITKE